MPGPVSFETMVNYVSSSVATVTRAMDNLSRELDRHQEWHRGSLEEQIRNQRSSGYSRLGLVVQWVSAMAALAAVVVAVVALSHHGAG